MWLTSKNVVFDRRRYEEGIKSRWWRSDVGLQAVKNSLQGLTPERKAELLREIWQELNAPERFYRMSQEEQMRMLIVLAREAKINHERMAALKRSLPTNVLQFA